MVRVNSETRRGAQKTLEISRMDDMQCASKNYDCEKYGNDDGWNEPSGHGRYSGEVLGTSYTVIDRSDDRCATPLPQPISFALASAPSAN